MIAASLLPVTGACSIKFISIFLVLISFKIASRAYTLPCSLSSFFGIFFIFKDLDLNFKNDFLLFFRFLFLIKCFKL